MVEALGVWGIRWIGEIGDEDLDPKLLLWDRHRNVDYAAVPPGRTVVQFRFPDVPSAGGLAIQGPAALRRALPRWFTLSDFAPVARPA